MIQPTIDPKVKAVFDYDVRKYISDAPYKDWYSDNSIFLSKEKYKTQYKAWLLNSKNSKIIGLDKFNNIDFTFGVTQSIDDLLLKHKTNRLRIFEYEYHYSRKLHENYETIVNNDIETGDWVLISLPFCFHGKSIDNLNELYDICYKKNVPVYIDAAFYALSFDFTLDLSHPAIKEVYFSLSKNLGLGFLRTGIRFSNESYYGPIAMQNQYNYSNLAFIELGSYVIDKFDIDYIVKKYYPHYRKFCQDQGFEETNCIHIALSRTKIGSDFLTLNDKTKVGLWWNDKIL